jgi:hypothetical protein
VTKLQTGEILYYKDTQIVVVVVVVIIIIIIEGKKGKSTPPACPHGAMLS